MHNTRNKKNQPQMEKIMQHPSLLIRKLQKDFIFQGQKPVTSNVQKGKTSIIMGKIEKQLRLGKAAVKTIMQHFPDDEDEVTQEAISDFYFEIVLSSFSPTFCEKYQEQFEELSTAEQLQKFIIQKLGTTTKLEDSRNADKQLRTICRNISEEEKFSDFLERIERTARKLDTGEEGRQYMVNSVFDRNLSPENRTFLIEREFEEKTSKEIASLLDKTQKFRLKQKVNKIAIDNTDEFTELRNQNEDKRQQIRELQLGVEEIRGEIASVVELLKQERQQSESQMVQAIQRKQPLERQQLQYQQQQPYQPQRQHQQVRPEQRQQQRQQQQPKRWLPDNRNQQQNWELNRFGSPIHCYQCGMMNHSSANCTGRCTAVCHMCNKIGHLQTVCPEQIAFNKTPKNW